MQQCLSLHSLIILNQVTEWLCMYTVDSQGHWKESSKPDGACVMVEERSEGKSAVLFSGWLPNSVEVFATAWGVRDDRLVGADSVVTKGQPSYCHDSKSNIKLLMQNIYEKERANSIPNTFQRLLILSTADCSTVACWSMRTGKLGFEGTVKEFTMVKRRVSFTLF